MAKRGVHGLSPFLVNIKKGKVSQGRATHLTAEGRGEVNHFVVDLQRPAVADLGLPPHQPQRLGHTIEGNELAVAILHVDHQLHACLIALVRPLCQKIVLGRGKGTSLADGYGERI